MTGEPGRIMETDNSLMKLQAIPKKVPEPKPAYHAEPSHVSHKPPQKVIHKPTEAPNKSMFEKIVDTVSGEAAYYIRCDKALTKFDLQKPYCDKCFASWARYKNIKYREVYCHGCGGKTVKERVSFEKPLCKGCYTKFFKK